MNKKVLTHYRQFSLFTNPGLYKSRLVKLPNEIHKLGLLVRKQLVHRTTLAYGNIGTNADLRFGDMTKIPWYRQPEDDYLVTATAMLAELYRRDKRGFVADRAVENKLILTCRFTAILTATILKSKNIPCRVRSGHAPYFNMGALGKVSADHWINQYWNGTRWVTIDVDGSLSMSDNNVDPYDIKENQFDFPATAWLNCRTKKDNPARFWNAKPETGLIVIAWALLRDFHCLMNDEIIYMHVPSFGQYEKFASLTQKEFSEIDNLATLMQDPDKNFDALIEIWNTNKDFRLLQGSLL